MKNSLFFLLTLSVGLIVANIYYIQPLLELIARDFSISDAQAMALATMTQLGAALGLLFLVPLGDTTERRLLITILLIIEAIALVITSIAHGFYPMLIACFFVGIGASPVHIIIPLAAHLSAPEKRGKILGTVMSGLLIGVLLSRTCSGIIAARLGWRYVYEIAAAAMLALSLALRLLLPKVLPTEKLRYIQLLKSVKRIFFESAQLREACLTGGVLFFCFSAFWTTLPFFLSSFPQHYGSDIAGLFGLVGAAGALGAPFFGQFADRKGPRFAVLLAGSITAVSLVFLGIIGQSIAGLIGGVIFLDVGIQSAHVSNQTRIYAAVPHAKSRANSSYMVSYFAGGAIGSTVGSLAWVHLGWRGVCATSCLLIVAVFTWVNMNHRNNKSQEASGY